MGWVSQQKLVSETRCSNKSRMRCVCVCVRICVRGRVRTRPNRRAQQDNGRRIMLLHSPDSVMVVREACLFLGLFFGLLFRTLSATWRRRSFSILTCRRYSFCTVTRSHSLLRNSSSDIRGGDFMGAVAGDEELLELETLYLSSSNGSEGKRSSSER